jgi:hypothetical protein
MASAPSLPQPESEPQSEPQSKLRLTSPAQILTAVPYLLGFSPARSVVVMCLRDKQVGLTMRLDIDTPPRELRETVVERLRADGANKAVIVLFDPDETGDSFDPGGSVDPGASADPADTGTRPGHRIARPLIRAVRRAGLTVVDAIVVHRGRFWSYLCDEPRCCPPEGRPLPTAGQPDHSLVASTFVAMGAAPMASREALHASIGAAAPERQAQLWPAFERALEAPAADPIDRWWEVVQRYREVPPRAPLPDDEAAQLVVSLGDVLIRDEVISWTAGDEISGVLAVLRELAPMAPPPFDTQVLASLAWSAYSFGDGALASAALNRALDSDPMHNLSRLLEVALTNGVDPEKLRSVSIDLITDLRRQESRASARSRDAR